MGISTIGPSDSVDRDFDLLDESELEKPNEVEKHRELCKQLMALRLTCERLAEIATRQLSRTFYLSPYLESSFEAVRSWTKIRPYIYEWRTSSQWIGSRQAV